MSTDKLSMRKVICPAYLIHLVIRQSLLSVVNRMQAHVKLYRYDRTQIYILRNTYTQREKEREIKITNIAKIKC